MKANTAFYIFSILLLTTTMSMAKTKPALSSPGSLSNMMSGLAASVAKFNSRLLQEIGGKTNGNIFYSPVSLHAVLSQLVLGSPKNSSTYTELVSALHLGSAADLGSDDDDQLLEGFLQQTETPGVKIVNKLYANQSTNIKQEFIDGLAKNFKSTIEQEDFSNPESTAEHINKFTNNQTNGLIPKIIEADSISANTELILLNVIYFKGIWKDPFKTYLTRETPFFVDANRTTTHKSMEIEGKFKTAYFNTLQSNLLSLPYKDEQTAMIVILPDDGVNVHQVEDNLIGMELGEIWEVLNSTNEDRVMVNLPKFEVSHDLRNLKKVLQNLGLVAMFDERNVNFSRISNEKNLPVSKIVQKAVIKVDEEGSEAAASELALRAPVSFPQRFTINRPFIFFIYDVNNSLPLFVGRIVDPNGEMSLQEPDLD